MKQFINFSRHLSEIMAQRGIKSEDIDAIYLFSDREKDLVKGKLSLSICKRKLKILSRRGDICSQQADRLRNKVIIWGEENEFGPAQVVTAFRAHGKTARKFL
ncbi:hypothetical protein OAL88_00650 [bacterium]|nr:hypothetical protein [bacterium]